MGLVSHTDDLQSWCGFVAPTGNECTCYCISILVTTGEVAGDIAATLKR